MGSSLSAYHGRSPLLEAWVIAVASSAYNLHVQLLAGAQFDVELKLH